MEVQELERYIKEDVERYGNKITELEKKLSQAYREVEIGPIDDALASDRDALVAYVVFGLVCLEFSDISLSEAVGATIWASICWASRKWVSKQSWALLQAQSQCAYSGARNELAPRRPS